MSLGRRAALAGLVMLVTGLSSCSATSCPDTGATPTTADCAGGLEFGNRVYVVQYLDRRIPTSEILETDQVAGRALPCNDNPGAVCEGSSARRSEPVTALRIRGIPAGEALVRGSDRSGRKALLVPVDTSYVPVVSARVQRLLETYSKHSPEAHGGPYAPSTQGHR